MAYKKAIQNRLEKLNKAKQLLEEAHELLKDVKFDVYGNTCEVECADELTQSASRFTNKYIYLIKRSKDWAFNGIRVPRSEDVK